MTVAITRTDLDAAGLQAAAARPDTRCASAVRPLREASAAAGITPAVNFHVLRRSYASRLVPSGAPIAVVTAQLGHADTRITKRQCAHLSLGHVADTVRATFTTMGIVGATNIVPLGAAR